MQQTERLYFLDHLRGFIIFLVIIFHVAIGYMAMPPQWWYVVDTSKNIVFDIFVMLVDVFIMPVMFLLAGYFTLPVLRRQGISGFWQNKFRRIVLPWLAGVFVFAPMITYMIFFSRPPVPFSYLTFWGQQFFLPITFNHAHYWFLGDLAWFFLALTALCMILPAFKQPASLPSRPSFFFFASFTIFTAAAFFAATLIWPPDTWYNQLYLISFQPSRLFICFAYFILGSYAWRHNWFTGGYQPSLRGWLPAAIIMTLCFTFYRIACPVPPTIMLKAGHAFVHSGFCLTMVFFLLALFQRYSNHEQSLWQSWSQNSYTIYYIHQFAILPLAYLTQKIAAPAGLKYIAVAAAAVIISYLASAYIINRLPFISSKR